MSISVHFALTKQSDPLQKHFLLREKHFPRNVNKFFVMESVTNFLATSCLRNVNQKTVSLHNTYFSEKYGILLAHLSTVEKYLQIIIFQKIVPFMYNGKFFIIQCI